MLTPYELSNLIFHKCIPRSYYNTCSWLIWDITYSMSHEISTLPYPWVTLLAPGQSSTSRIRTEETWGIWVKSTGTKTQQNTAHGPLARYVKLRVAHAPAMPGTFSPPPRVSDPDMHHGTCVTHVPWCMLGSLTSVFLWSQWRGKRSRHSRRMRKRQFYVSGKRPMSYSGILSLLQKMFLQQTAGWKMFTAYQKAMVVYEIQWAGYMGSPHCILIYWYHTPLSNIEEAMQKFTIIFSASSFHCITLLCDAFFITYYDKIDKISSEKKLCMELHAVRLCDSY